MMLPSRRAYILDHLNLHQSSNHWIKITDEEMKAFGGLNFFNGCEITSCNSPCNTAPGVHGWIDQGRVQLHWKIAVVGRNGWRPKDQYDMSIDATPTNESEPEMHEHHIDRDTLTTVVIENKEDYIEAFRKCRNLYAERLAAKAAEHLAGKIPQNEVRVTKADGVRVDLPPDMTNRYDNHLRALQLDHRDVVILTHEEYRNYVEDTDSNKAQLDALIEAFESEGQ
jgi:hypothetical protein